MKRMKTTSTIALLILAATIATATAQTPPTTPATPATPTTDTVSPCVAEARASENPTARLTALGRAKNLARQAAEEANGGLGSYHAEAAMHAPIGLAPCTVNANGGWTFTFKGGEPGFTTPTIESVVTVDPSNWNVTVDSNGPIRQAN
jgi:hypothetical protein